VQLRKTAKQLAVKILRLPPSMIRDSRRTGMFLKFAQEEAQVDLGDDKVVMKRMDGIFDNIARVSAIDPKAKKSMREDMLVSHEIADVSGLYDSYIWMRDHSNKKSYASKVFSAFAGAIAKVTYYRAASATADAPSILLSMGYCDKEADVSVLDEEIDRFLPDNDVVRSLLLMLGKDESIFVNELVSRVAIATHNNMYSENPAPAEMFVKYTVASMHWWMSVLKTKITAIPLVNVTPSSKASLRKFYIVWMNHYAKRFADTESELNTIREHEDDEENWSERLSELSWKNFYYRCLYHGFKNLVKSVIDSSQDEFEKFFDGCLMPFARIRWKHKIPEQEGRTVTELVGRLASMGKNKSSQMLTRATKDIDDMCLLVAKDLGIVSSPKLGSSPIRKYDSEEIKKSITLIRDESKQHVRGKFGLHNVVVQKYASKRRPGVETDIWQRATPLPVLAVRSETKHSVEEIKVSEEDSELVDESETIYKRLEGEVSEALPPIEKKEDVAHESESDSHSSDEETDVQAIQQKPTITNRLVRTPFLARPNEDISPAFATYVDSDTD